MSNIYANCKKTFNSQFGLRTTCTRIFLSSLCTILFFVAGAGNAWGQGQDVPLQQSGIPMLSEQIQVPSGVVSTTNGNLHIEIPIGTYPQRGQKPNNVKLTYDSNMYNLISAMWQFQYKPNNISYNYFPVPGWGFTGFPSGATLWDMQYTTCRSDGNDETDTDDQYMYVEPDGVTHSFPVYMVIGFVTACGDFTSRSITVSDKTATDGSGYFYGGGVSAPDGTSPGASDTNGNFSHGATTYYQDSIGRTLYSYTQNTTNQTITITVPNAEGTTSSYVLQMGVVNIHTNFDSNWQYNYYVYEPTSLTLPDGTKYSFTYDSGTTSGHYGLLTSMTLPTGGTINYTYNNFSDAELNPIINRMLYSMATPDGTWTFTPAVTSQCTATVTLCQETITIQKPAIVGSSDNTVYTSVINAGIWLTEADYYSGAIASSNLVATQKRSYDLSHTNPYTGSPYYIGPAGAMQVTKLSETTTLPIPGGTNLNQTTQFCYDNSLGNLLYKWEWNFYTGSIVHDPNPPPTCSLYSGSTPDRTTTFSYLGGSNYLTTTGRNISNRPTSIVVTNASSGIVSKTLYSYDGGTLVGSPTGVVNHDDTNFGSGLIYRGNLTQIQRLVSGTSNYLTKSMTYDITGQMRSETDWNNNGATYSYADNYYNDGGDSSNPTSCCTSSNTNAYLTSITQGSLVTSLGHYWGTGAVASVTDPNSQTSYSHFYDLMNRPTSTQTPNGGWALTPWDLTGTTETGLEAYTGITSTQSTGCSSCRHDKVVTDGLGRLSTTKLVNDPDDPSNGTNGVISYDSHGRVSSVSNPYRTSSDPTYGSTTFLYDGLDRKTQITEADGSPLYTYYGATITSPSGQTTQQCSTSTYGRGYPILMIDEVGHRRQTWTDGFGRIIETDEPNSSGMLSPKSCYIYDLNNNLTAVLGADGSQTRSYTYDMISRVLSKTVPETKQNTTYFYYTNSGGGLCSGDLTQVCRRTDPRGITTTYTYDALNRITAKTFSDSTWPTFYGYDSTSTNGKGRLAYEDTYNPGLSAWVTADWFYYDAVGNIAQNTKWVAGVYQYLYYTYNLDSSAATVKYPGGRIVTYTEGNAQRVTAVADVADSITYATSGKYAPQGDIGSVQNGTSLNSTYIYNPRLQPCRISIRSTGSAPGTCTDTSNIGNVFDLAYSYAQGIYGFNNGNITTITNNNSSGRTQAFTYDPVNRLLSAQSSATSGSNCWAETYGNNATPPTLADDWLNNLWLVTNTACSSPGLSVSVNSYNQITNSGFNYDSAGDETGDSSNTYTFDAENQLTSVVAAGTTYCYTYDANGQRMAKGHGTSCASPTWDKIYWRSTGGPTLAETDSTGSTTNSNYNEYIFFNGQRIAQSIPSLGSVYYYVSDHLGSTRVVTSATGSPCYEADFLPYGQEYTPSGFGNTCSTNYKFTGYERDPETNNDYAFARYYSSRLFRFLSPDPLDGDIGDPQTLNKYAYARNNPVNLIDPTGMDSCEGGCPEPPPGPDCEYDVCLGSPNYPGSGDDKDTTNVPLPIDNDPFVMGCEMFGMPCGMQFPSGGRGISGCTYGGGSCGGMIYGFGAGNGSPQWKNQVDYLDWLQGALTLAGSTVDPMGHCYGGDAICIPGQTPRTGANIKSDNFTNGLAAALVTSGAGIATAVGKAAGAGIDAVNLYLADPVNIDDFLTLVYSIPGMILNYERRVDNELVHFPVRMIYK